MIVCQLADTPLQEVGSPLDPTLRYRLAFPLSAAGTQATAVVALAVPPGGHLGQHTDSAEEVVLVLEGEGEAVVGAESVPVGPGTLIVIPAMAPHDLRNRGTTLLRALGFFAAATVVSTFRPSPLPGAEALIALHGPAGTEIMLASRLG
jgi:mannose-6-phosphate isomerase-like protein (cupin superfamily)